MKELNGPFGVQTLDYVKLFLNCLTVENYLKEMLHVFDLKASILPLYRVHSTGWSSERHSDKQTTDPDGWGSQESAE